MLRTAQSTEQERGEADEASPLLPSYNEATNGRVEPSTSPTYNGTRCSWPWIYVIALCIGIAVISDIGEYLYTTPRVRLFESVVCRNYYTEADPSLIDRDGAIPEHLCKVNPVQDKVASILGWQFFFDSIPAILLPIPFGYLADKHGRKWIITLAMLGFLLSCAWTLFSVGVLHLPLQYVWLSSLFSLIAGGPTTGTTMLTTIVADVVPPELRGTVFFYRFCADLVAELCIPPVTFGLMSKNIWIPLLGAILFQGIAVLMIAIAVPETLPVVSSNKASDIVDSPSVATNTAETGRAQLLRNRCKGLMRNIADLFGFITRDITVAALVFTFLISKIGRQSSNIMLQYVSKRYGWSISQAGLLLSLRAAVNIALFTVFLPGIATFALSRLSTVRRDLLIAKGSIVLMIVGAFGIFIAATPTVMITGFPPIARSLVTTLVESHHASKTSDIGRLYAVISVMEGIGSLVAAPGMAWAFRVGMKLGQEWLGLPFGFAAILFALVSIVVFSIRVDDA